MTELTDGAGGGGDGGGGDGGGAAAAGGALDLLGGAAAGGAAGAEKAAGGDSGEAGAGGGGDAGAADPEWYGQVSADVGEGEKASLRDWIKSAGVKDLTGLAKIARDNQAAVRDSGRIKVPGEGATPEEIKAFRAGIGVPDDPAGYALPEVLGSDGKSVALDEGLLGTLKPVAHKFGVPKAAFDGLVAEFVKGQLDQVATDDAAQNTAAQAWLTKQGENGNAKVAAIDSAAKVLGLSKQDMMGIRGALGADRALEMFATLGAGMSEDTLLGDGGGGGKRFGISGAEAQAELDRLKKDPEFAKKNIPGSAERQRWDRLQAAAGAAAERKRHEEGG